MESFLYEQTKKTLRNQRIRFDLPIFYNKDVKKWMLYFQGRGKKRFEKWLTLSHRYLPFIRKTLKEKGLPKDLAFLVYIESGFSAHAQSPARAVGYWQFIESTANQYGLKTNWWLDERKSFVKSTRAATDYLKYLYQIFNSWYLTPAAYNMGETKLLRLIRKHKTKNFLLLSKKKDFPSETRNYLPKLMATMIMAKNYRSFGFKKQIIKKPYHLKVDHLMAPGGMDLYHLAHYLKMKPSQLKTLNPEILKAFIPHHIKNHMIQVPKGSTKKVFSYIKEYINKNYRPIPFQITQNFYKKDFLRKLESF